VNPPPPSVCCILPDMHSHSIDQRELRVTDLGRSFPRRHNLYYFRCVQVRVMPNTPCLIGQCASAFVTGNNATDDDSEKTFALMSAVGEPIHPPPPPHTHRWTPKEQYTTIRGVPSDCRRISQN